MQLYEVNEIEAKLLVDIMKQNIDIYRFASARRRVKEYYNQPDKIDMIMTVLDELLDTFGIEELYWQDGQDEYRALYLNTGQAYEPTIMYLVDTQSWIVSNHDDLMRIIMSKS